MKLSEFSTPASRRSFLEKERRVKLINIKNDNINDKKNVHGENIIGATTIPLGVAGPLKLKGESIEGNFYIPLATTEGALVASVNRGCKVITQSGGAHTYVHRVGTTRGPVFFTENLENSKRFYRWMKSHESVLAEIAEKTSRHVKLKKIEIRTLSNYAFVRFYFDTQDAMGMNMATIAADSIAHFIEKETHIKCVSVAGNYDIDKKPAWINFINNRGFKGWSEVIIPKKIVKEILKSDSQEIFEVWLAKCMIGSAISGSLGFNAHFANVVSAFFAATGQDLAHTVEGSLGITVVRPLKNGDLYCSVYMPSVLIATVGGGTKFASQKEALSIIGVSHSSELAEVLAGAVLAGELSLLASLAEGSLAKVHEKLGR